MKSASILPFLCVLAAAAPAFSIPGREVDVHRRQSTDDDGLGDLLGGVRARQSSDDDDDDDGLGGLLGGLRARQSSDDDDAGLDDVLGGLKRRQSSNTPNDFGNVLSDLPTRQNSDSDNNSNDDSLGNILDDSSLSVDGNGQNVDIADLGSLLRRQLLPAPSTSSTSGNNDNSDQLANVLDGSAADINRNAQNVSVARRQFPSKSENGNGNGDDNESLLNVLDGDTGDVNRNIQNITVLRRTSSKQSVGKRGWLSALLGRDTPSTTNNGNGNGDNDESLANVLDGSAAAVDDNVQGVSVLRRQASSSSATPSPTPSASAAPIVQDPTLNAANDNDNNNASNNDALLNAADDSSADVSKNLQNITILKHRRQNAGDKNGDVDDDDTLGNIVDGSAVKADGNAEGVDVGDIL
ncbi:conserved hypothetical protein [Talaromyces stipitatus ATCC 10500]|uniref:Uncharacterized protein n=1 Tax=Talaromyces stipitatus (strain ATCC 10500 / CBS 375.48 / QM 6759 / NRRL 1006) TaxID=441959 RepID=B8MK51_TALSN|nr:uncharacterized protein TSTA_043430 [Talaromyces stipitatus ATCC 10500]EED14868.1 conserved hypothetical protein [Talaromyces stipitatus ATCC 10500]